MCAFPGSTLKEECFFLKNEYCLQINTTASLQHIRSLFLADSLKIVNNNENKLSGPALVTRKISIKQSLSEAQRNNLLISTAVWKQLLIVCSCPFGSRRSLLVHHLISIHFSRSFFIHFFFQFKCSLSSKKISFSFFSIHFICIFSTETKLFLFVKTTLLPRSLCIFHSALKNKSTKVFIRTLYTVRLTNILMLMRFCPKLQLL